MLPPSVLASLRFLGGAFWAALTAGEQFDLITKLHDLLHAGGGAASASLAQHHPHLSKLELEWTVTTDGKLTEVVDEADPMDVAEAAANAVSVSHAGYNTGHGWRPIPAAFCRISSPADRCTADNLIDLQNQETRSKVALGRLGIDKNMAICLNAASKGATQSITLESYLDHCGRGHRADLGSMGPLTVSLSA